MPRQIIRHPSVVRKLVWATVIFEFLAVASIFLIFSIISENACSSDALAYWVLLPLTLGLAGISLAIAIVVIELRRKQNKKVRISLLFVLGCVIVSGSAVFNVGLPFALCGIGGN